MQKFECPVCGRDLSNAMEVLSDPIGVYEMHMVFHIRDKNAEIFRYLSKNKKDLPQKLVKIDNQRLTDIRSLVKTKAVLKMLEENGSL